MRAFILAVTGLVISIAACSTYGTSVVEVGKTKVPVASVSISVPQSLVAGQTARATATPKDANGTALLDRAVTWFTSAGAVATVTDSGVIGAVAPGTAVLSAVSEGVSAKATMTVIPVPTPIAVVAVVVNPSAVVLGQTAHATATLEDSTGAAISGDTIAWESSDITVATVNASGDVKAVGLGNAMIKGSSRGKSAAAALNVSAPAPNPVATVTVSPATANLQIGGTVQLSAATSDANGNPLTGRVISWASSNPAIATASTSGQVTAIAAGTVSVTASSEGKTGSASITVASAAPVPVASVSVSPATATLQIGGTVQLSAVTRDGSNNVLNGRVVAWSSSNNSISTVSAAGLVTAVAAGSATITATSEGVAATSAITVSAPAPVPVASVSVSPASSSIYVGATIQLSAVTRDANNNVLTGRVVTWSSSNTGIGTVSASGLVTGITTGTATITATSEGRTSSASVSVTLAPVASVTISPASATVAVGQTQLLSVTLRDAGGRTLTGRSVSWASSSTGIATVSPTGSVLAVAVGGATITATSEGINGTASITVSAPLPPGTGPEPAAGDVILLQDDFNKTTLALQLAGYGYAGSFARVTDGHSGEAIRVSYNSTSWNTNTFGKSLSSVATDAYYRYWYRLSPGADPSCGGRNWSGFKWFMTHRADPAPRYTHGVGMLTGGPAGFENSGLEFSTHDNSSTREPNPFMQNVDKTKRFNTTNDGQWHEYTIHIVTGNGGYEQIWIDGLKVLDSQSYAYDHDPIGIDNISLPGTMVQWYSGCEFTVDIDDIVVWHK